MIETDSLTEVMEDVSTTILHHTTTGKVQFDVPAVHYVNGPKIRTGNKPANSAFKPKSNIQSSQRTKSNGVKVTNRTCYYCNEPFTDPKEHREICKGMKGSCEKCGENHFAVVCDKYRKERASLENSSNE